MSKLKNLVVLSIGLLLFACGGDEGGQEDGRWSSDEKENFYIDCERETGYHENMREICECLLDDLASEASYAEYERVMKKGSPEYSQESEELMEYIEKHYNDCEADIFAKHKDSKLRNSKKSARKGRSYYDEDAALVFVQEIVKGAQLYHARYGELPYDCWESMYERDLIYIDKDLVDAWEFECDWEYDYYDGRISGSIYAGSKDFDCYYDIDEGDSDCYKK